MKVRKLAVVGAAVVLGGLSVACTTGDNVGGTTKDKPITTTGATTAAAAPATTKAAPEATQEAPAKATKKAAPKAATISGDGTFAIGSQVKPGTYRSVVPGDSYGCYYARLKNASGEFDAIIANDNGDPGAQKIVQIKKSDKYFETRGCGTWTRVG